MEPYVEIAERIARQSHAGQLDKQGEPYIKHVERVAASFDDPVRKAAGWLHDVIEDTPVSLVDLQTLEIPAEVVEIVRVLTKDKSKSYKDYIERLLAHPDRRARDVKIVDLRDNVSRGMLFSLQKRYEWALHQIVSKDI